MKGEATEMDVATLKTRYVSIWIGAEGSGSERSPLHCAWVETGAICSKLGWSEQEFAKVANLASHGKQGLAERMRNSMALRLALGTILEVDKDWTLSFIPVNADQGFGLGAIGVCAHRLKGPLAEQTSSKAAACASAFGMALMLEFPPAGTAHLLSDFQAHAAMAASGLDAWLRARSEASELASETHDPKDVEAHRRIL